jgi:hypothetical protein
VRVGWKLIGEEYEAMTPDVGYGVFLTRWQTHEQNRRRQAIELNIKEAKKIAEQGDALVRLSGNRDFRNLVIEGYFEREAVRLVSPEGRSVAADACASGFDPDPDRCHRCRVALLPAHGSDAARVLGQLDGSRPPCSVANRIGDTGFLSPIRNGCT